MSSQNIFLEYIQESEGKYEVFALQINFENFNQPICMIRNQFGFLQEIRFKIDTENTVISSMKAPYYSSNTVAFSPHYVCNFELGQFLYPILLRPFLFNSKYYNYYTQLFYFYIIYSFCDPPYYYLNIPFHHIEDGKDFNIILIYRHPVVFHVCPIQYRWCLYKILIPITNNSCLVQIQVHEKFKDMILQMYENRYTIPMNHLSTRELVPEILWSHFLANYTYRFGFTYAFNGVFPSNNEGIDDHSEAICKN